MDPIILVTITFLAFLTLAFFVWFTIHKSKEKERLLLLEKGLDPTELPERSTFSFSFPWLKVGCVVTCASIGLLIGVVLLQNNFLKGGGEPVLGMLIFGGIGLIIAHYVDKPNEKS